MLCAGKTQLAQYFPIFCEITDAQQLDVSRICRRLNSVFNPFMRNVLLANGKPCIQNSH